MVAFKFLLAATASGLVTAWPEPVVQPRAVDCAKVTGCFSVLKKIGPQATTFCSSFLKIPATKTATTIVTLPPVTKTTSTSTVKTTNSVCGQQKRNVPFNYRAFEFAEPAGVDKRGDILPLLAAFAAAKISEGCSCLNLQPKVTTTTTITAAKATTNVVATTTQCVLCKNSGPGQTCNANSDCCAGSCAALNGVLTCCKTNGVGKSCSANTDCCTGNCGTQFGTRSCCTPNGGNCDLGNPGACCSASCETNGSGTLEGTCVE